MIRPTRFMYIFLIFFIWFNKGTAQNGDFTINLNLYNVEALNALYLSDLDLFQQGLEGGGQEIFSLQIVKNTGDAFPQTRMIIDISRDGQSLVNWESNIFRIPGDPAGTIYQTDNLELSNNMFAFSQDDPQSTVRFIETKLNDEIEDLKQKVLASGKVPTGQYLLQVSMFNLQAGSEPIAQNEIVLLNAINPSYVQLIYPGSEAGFGTPDQVYTQYPVFQWAGNGEEYQVAVFEKRSALQSFDDIINSQPNWESNRLMQGTQNIQYPQAGNVIPLEYGNTYYWMVRMFNETSTGEETIQSEIWQFRLINPANIGDQPNKMAARELMQFLENVLPDMPASVKELLSNGSLQSINHNGQKISREELYRILKGYRGKDVEVYDIIYNENK
ncbi:MAG: hypothetical protein GF313_13545 [Caldithrix sp.]|nr:hypothetical protein [Caldithrix sp.]